MTEETIHPWGRPRNVHDPFDIPQVDMFEASVPTRPIDIRPGNRIAVSWDLCHTVVDVRIRPVGAYLTLRDSRGNTYEIYRKSDLPVVGQQ